jgi:hypothetical protein
LLYLVDSTLKQASKVPASQQSQHVSHDKPPYIYLFTRHLQGSWSLSSLQ